MADTARIILHIYGEAASLVGSIVKKIGTPYFQLAVMSKHVYP